MSSVPQGKFHLSAKKKAVLEALLSKEGMAREEDRIPRRRESGPVPLSFSQQRLWFFDQFEPANFVYNLLSPVSLRGKLDVSALQQAFNNLALRHETLRTTFELRDGQPVQIIHSQHSIPLRHFELTHLSQAAQQEEIQRLLREQARQPFDLNKGPLLRISLLRLAPQDHILILAMHHIVTDAWSMDILVRETITLYEAYSGGRLPDLPPLALQYADFAVWQRNWLQGDVLAQQVEYWKQRLGDKPVVLELPTDRSRSAVQTYRGADWTFPFSPPLSQSVKAFCRAEGVTLFMVLLAAFKVLLHRYTGEPDITVGSPISNRHRKELEGLIGFFVNTLPIRTSISGDLSFRELLERVKEAALGAYAHQDLPFEYLVEQLLSDRDLSHSPLVQVLFNFEAVPPHTELLPGLEATMLNNENQAAKFDLTLFTRDRGSEIFGSLEYNVDLFNKDTIERMAGHLLTLLSAAMTNPAKRIAELPLLTRHERYKILTEWNATEAAYPLRCAHHLVEEQARRTPDAAAVLFEHQELSYGQFNARASQVARYLSSRGAGPGKLVGIFMERSQEMIVAVLGILKSGAACLPLDPAYPKERLAFMLEDSGAELVVSQQDLASSLPCSVARVVCLDVEAQTIMQERPEDPAAAVTPENGVYVIYTSGSTGRPKGVVVPHRVLVNLVKWHHGSQRQSKRTLQFASLNFDVSFQEIFSTLAAGGTLVVASQSIRLDVSALGTYVEEHKVERLHLPGVVLQKLAEEFSSHPKPLSGVREIMAGGEQLQITSPVAELFRQLKGCRLYNHYGPTESLVVTSFALPDNLESWPALPPLGRPVFNTELYVLDSYLQPVPITVPGELYIAGACLAHGYLKQPDLTAEKFIPNPFSSKPGSRMYKTGDLARYLADGNVEFLGRNDFQVKIRGMRVELGEIELELKRHPAVCEAAVTLVKDSPGSRFVAYVVFQPGKMIACAEMREFLHQRLPEHMLPSTLVALDMFPLTPSGKIDRRALPAPGKPESSEIHVAPRTALEEVLAAIFCEVLQLEDVGILDDFFALGGHSLLATQVSSRVRQFLHVELPVRKIFEQPTISGLARTMLEDGGEPEKLERNAKLLMQLSSAPEGENLLPGQD
jgi:amino acid adenylation domain-containing protein